MKILLVNPYIYDFTAYDLWLRPLGLLYLAAVVKKYTDADIYWLDVLDRFQEDNPPPSKADGRGKYRRELVEKPGIYEPIPRNYARYGIPLDLFQAKLDRLPEVDLILVTSLMTYWIDGITFTVGHLRRRFPKAKIVLGGVLPTLVPEGTRESAGVDYTIKGYGEKQVLRLVEDRGGTVYPHPDFSTPDHIPFPAFEFLENPEILPLLTSRGCPFHCTYCASNLLNEHFLERSAENVGREIVSMFDRYGTRHFIFFDDALLVNKHRRFFKIFRELPPGIDVNFHTPNGIHAREVDRETAEILFKSGFKTLRLSFESTKAGTLSRSSGKVDVRQMVAAVENLERAGFQRGQLECYLLFGLPGQEVAEIEDSLHFVNRLGIVPHLAYFSPVPGTRDFINLRERGILSSPLNLYETNKIYFLYRESGFSGDEIRHIKNLAAKISETARKPPVSRGHRVE